MPLSSLRRLALGDLDDATLRGLIDQGEHLLVERKRDLPKDSGFGAAVTSFANTIGGWLLLGVDDDGSLFGWQPKGGADIQSHLGQILRNQVDPLPPFVAATRELDGASIGVVRIFESSDTPHIVKATGAVYVRDSSGKQPIRDAAHLLALARRGDEAKSNAAHRLGTLSILREALTPESWASFRGDLKAGELPPVDHLTLIVKAAVLTVTPQFNDWAISSTAARVATNEARGITERLGVKDAPLNVEPRGRGCVASCGGPVHDGNVRVALAIDSGGAIGARIVREALAGPRRRDQIDADLLALTFAVDDCLRPAEAYGQAVWELMILMPATLGLADATSPSFFFASADLPVPAETDELGRLRERWMREYYRQSGVPEWEPEATRQS